MGSLELFAWAGLKLILLISASQVTRIAGVSHLHLATSFFLIMKFVELVSLNFPSVFGLTCYSEKVNIKHFDL
jgi:hypothetical protein